MIESVFPDLRPPPDARRFHSPIVEDTIKRVTAGMADPELAWLFANCFPNTLDTTVVHNPNAAGHPDTYVITGDIDAMWLRDSTAQIWPYLPLAREDESLRALLEGVIRRQTTCVLLDPYANAFYDRARFGIHRDDHTEMKPGVHERKWELDSLAYFLRLSHGYWSTTGDPAPFDTPWIEAVTLVLSVAEIEQQGTSASSPSPYRFQRTCRKGNSLLNGGRGDPARPCGLVRTAFRPSDDPCKLPYLVPSNAMFAATLRDLTPLLERLSLKALASKAAHLSGAILQALEANAVVTHERCGEIWAYEIDGFGGRYLMDDANVPSLLSLPYLGVCPKDDPRYQRTRAFCLSQDNPYYASGAAGAGIGSPHTKFGSIWPIAITMQALTATSDDEIIACLGTLKHTHADTGYMHESFRCENATSFTRPWFAWANTLFGELILSLHRDRPQVLLKTL